MSSQAASILQELARSINFYYSAIMAPIGILLNMATIFVFYSKRIRTTTMSLLYISLAISDTLSLLNSVLFSQLLPSLRIDLMILSEFSCKFFTVWRRSVIQAPSWILVFITVERFRSVCYPAKWKFLENKRILIIITLGIYFVLILLGSTYWTFTVKKTINYNDSSINGSNVQDSLECVSSHDLISFVTDIIVMLMRCHIPFVVMLILNIKLTKRFLLSRRKFSTARATINKNNASKESANSMKKENYFTRTVLTMNFTFLFYYFFHGL
jgi:hypothetical protein